MRSGVAGVAGVSRSSRISFPFLMQTLAAGLRCFLRCTRLLSLETAQTSAQKLSLNRRKDFAKCRLADGTQ